MSADCRGKSATPFRNGSDKHDDVTADRTPLDDATVPKTVVTAEDTSEITLGGQSLVVQMSENQEGHVNIGQEVNTIHNHTHYSISCEQLVVPCNKFTHNTFNDSSPEQPNRKEPTYPCTETPWADPSSNIQASHVHTLQTKLSSKSRASFIHTQDLEEAADILEDRGRVVLCGGPGSGKTTLAHALLRIYQGKGHQVFTVTHVQEILPCIMGRGRSVVLMDGVLGEVRLDMREYKAFRSVLRPLEELVRGGKCLLIMTMYPHVLREVDHLEAKASTFILQSTCVAEIPTVPHSPDAMETMIKFHLQGVVDGNGHDDLVKAIVQKNISGAAFPWCCRQMAERWWSMTDPTVFFTSPAEVHVPLIQRMIRHPEHGETMAAVMTLTMLGSGHFLHHPCGVRSQLEALGFRDLPDYKLEECADVLKGSILNSSGDGFYSRVVYDAVGLALGRSFPLPILLKVCDVKFLVQHVRTTETATEFSVTIGPSPDDRQLLMQTMYEHLVSGRLPELCQHPSLHCPQFLQEFETFCRANKNYVRRVISAVDTVHRMPLLYWSVWGPSGNLTEWCLKLTEEEGTGGKMKAIYVQSALACFLVDKASYGYPLLPTVFNNTGIDDTEADVPLPTREQCYGDKLLAARDRITEGLQADSLCYLDDPTLPIPDTLVSMEVRSSHDGDKVCVVVPSKQWYLALRLLADKEVDERDDEGNTLLHVAAEAGDLEAVEIAVRSGASLSATNNKGHTPTQLAAHKRDLREKTVVDNDCLNHLHKACRDGDEAKVKVLLCSSLGVDDKDITGCTPLHIACTEGQAHIADLLIALGADVNVKSDTGGNTPLHFSCWGGHTLTSELLIQQQADVNATNETGRTPLHFACSNGLTQTDLLLLDHRADVNVRNNNGRTPLHDACYNGQMRSARLLLQRHADVNAVDDDGYTPFHDACACGHAQISLLLIEHGAEVDEAKTAPEPRLLSRVARKVRRVVLDKIHFEI